MKIQECYLNISYIRIVQKTLLKKTMFNLIISLTSAKVSPSQKAVCICGCKRKSAISISLSGILVFPVIQSLP